MNFLQAYRGSIEGDQDYNQESSLPKINKIIQSCIEYTLSNTVHCPE